MDVTSCNEFISCVNKFIQTLSSGGLQFHKYFQLRGHLYLSLDDDSSVEFIVDEKVCKTNVNNSIVIFTNTCLGNNVLPAGGREVANVDSTNVYDIKEISSFVPEPSIQQGTQDLSKIVDRQEGCGHTTDKEGLRQGYEDNLNDNDCIDANVVDHSSQNATSPTVQQQESDDGYNLLNIDLDPQDKTLFSEESHNKEIKYEKETILDPSSDEREAKEELLASIRLLSSFSIPKIEFNKTSSNRNQQKSQQHRKSNSDSLIDKEDENHHACHSCGMGFKTKQILKRHMIVHSNEKPYMCDTCGKTFSRPGSLKYHVGIHLTEKPFDCVKCGLKFKRKQLLKQHMKCVHSDKPHQCETCGKSFSRIMALKYHVGLHLTEKPFKCSICEASFSSKPNLNQHNRLVHAERNFACDTCDKRFKSQRHLQIHKRTHSVQERPYVCRDCGKSFAQTSSLNLHRLTHSDDKPHVCPLCKKGFKLKQSLNTHITTHSEEKPFNCDICGHSVKNIKTLRSHKRSHLGLPKLKPFKCLHCDSSFTSRLRLKKHQQTHVSNDSSHENHELTCASQTHTSDQQTHVLTNASHLHTNESTMKEFDINDSFVVVSKPDSNNGVGSIHIVSDSDFSNMGFKTEVVISDVYETI